jgi:hypothetical protein
MICREAYPGKPDGTERTGSFRLRTDAGGRINSSLPNLDIAIDCNMMKRSFTIQVQ